MKLRYPAVAICLTLALAIRSTGAAEPPRGSKNFNSPGSVPNYFSNEAAPFVASPNPHPAPAEPVPAAAAPSPAPERATPVVVSPQLCHLPKAVRALKLSPPAMAVGVGR